MDYIQIGKSTSDCFTLTVTVHSASGLATLFEDMPGPMWLSYKLFGVLVQTDQFSAPAAFAPIRDIFRFRGALADVFAYLQTVSKVDVYLCSPGVVLGAASLPLHTLLCDATGGTRADPDFVEAEATGGFVLQPIHPKSLAVAYTEGRLTGAAATVNGVVQLCRTEAPPSAIPAPAARLQSVTAPKIQNMAMTAEVSAQPASPDRESVASIPAPATKLSPRDAVAAAEILDLKRQLQARDGTLASKERELDDSVRRLRCAEEGFAAEIKRRTQAAEAEQAELKTAHAQEVQELRRQISARDDMLASKDRDASEAAKRFLQLKDLELAAAASQAVSREASLASEIQDLRRQLLSRDDALVAKDREVQEIAQRYRTAEAELLQDAKRRQQVLEQEWAEREQARVRDLLSAQDNYQKLELRLRKTLAEVERRDAQQRLVNAEKEQAVSLKLAELEIVRRRLKDECDCAVKLEQQRMRAVTERLEEVSSELHARKAREAMLEQELLKLREKELRTPAGELLQKVAAAEADKAALLREIDSLKQDIKEKESQQETTRVQMIRLAKELARMRQEERERSQRDLEKLRVEYLAREGRYVLDGDRATLRDIRQQLENLSHTQ